MNYKGGDRVKIKSLDWYNENKNDKGNVVIVKNGVEYHFTDMDAEALCGKEVIIVKVLYAGVYLFKGIDFCFYTDEMIEGLVEDSNELDTKAFSDGYDQGYDDGQHDISEWNLPKGYQFKDENGNVINAMKIVLEKKKKEYPKTYEECLKVLGIEGGRLMFNNSGITQYERELYIKMNNLSKLLICRDAYWKIAGDEMGLGKPWKPSDSDYITGRYCIFVHRGNILCDTPAQDCILTFPTEEMRDVFYENFKELIESVKELL